MKTWQYIVTAVVSLLVVAGVPVGALIVMDDRHQSVPAAAAEKDAIRVIVAQSAAALQSGVSANQLQLMQWELNDIYARFKAGKPQIGDEARKIVLEARIKALVSK